MLSRPGAVVKQAAPAVSPDRHCGIEAAREWRLKSSLMRLRQRWGAMAFEDAQWPAALRLLGTARKRAQQGVSPRPPFWQTWGAWAGPGTTRRCRYFAIAQLRLLSAS